MPLYLSALVYWRNENRHTAKYISLHVVFGVPQIITNIGCRINNFIVLGNLSTIF